MRYVYVILIACLIALTLTFSLQNMGIVTISFLNTSATLPLAVLVILVFVSGMITGGSVLAIVRSWIRRAGRRP
jgi:uncharacterized integral membrane protein